MSEQDFHRSLEALTPEVLAWLRSRTGFAEAEDLLQTTLLTAVEKQSSLKQPSRLRAWLYQIARRKLIDSQRKGVREPVSEFVESAAPTPAEGPCACATNLTKRLAPGQAEVLRLVDVEGETLTEAAARLGSSANAVAVQLHRARKKLRREIEAECGAVDFESAAHCQCDSALCE